MGDQLTEHASRLRTVAARARLLGEQTSTLEYELRAWERRVGRARRAGDPELLEAAAKMAGRVGGQLDAARHELAARLDDEIAIREVLLEQRCHWLRMLDDAQRLGLDVSGCVTTIDLSVPPPPDSDGLPDDEEREFVARVIDGMAVH